MKYLKISDKDYELVCNLVRENGCDVELIELSDIIDELIDRGRLTAKITFDV